MNPNWDLSYLYKGFDDPAFLADLKRFPEEIKVEQAILDGGDDPQTKLEKLTDQLYRQPCKPRRPDCRVAQIAEGRVPPA
jgi:hypothetical protein